jgi:hypothetical protein
MSENILEDACQDINLSCELAGELNWAAHDFLLSKGNFENKTKLQILKLACITILAGIIELEPEKKKSLKDIIRILNVYSEIRDINIFNKGEKHDN